MSGQADTGRTCSCVHWRHTPHSLASYLSQPPALRPRDVRDEKNPQTLCETAQSSNGPIGMDPAPGHGPRPHSLNEGFLNLTRHDLTCQLSQLCGVCTFSHRSAPLTCNEWKSKRTGVRVRTVVHAHDAPRTNRRRRRRALPGRRGPGSSPHTGAREATT